MPRSSDDRTDSVEPVRYAIRQVGAGWTVYDYRNLEPVRVQGRLQIGLEHAAAKAMAELLSRAARPPGVAGGLVLPKAA